jgi:hypothetical protein
MKGGFGCSPCCAPVGDCFDGASTDTGYDSFDNSAWFASGISVGASAITLTSVVIYNDGYDQPLVSAIGGGYTNAPLCWIWANDTTDTSLPYGPKPVGVAGGPSTSAPSTRTALTPPASFSGATWTYTHPGLTLSANTIYWVVVGTTGTQVGYWQYIDYYLSVAASESCYVLGSFSTNAGATWTQNVALTKWVFDYS